MHVQRAYDLHRDLLELQVLNDPRALARLCRGGPTTFHLWALGFAGLGVFKGDRPPPSQGGGPPATGGSSRQTPCLPCGPLGNWSQPTATVSACSRPVSAQRTCHRLPPVATTGLHKGSIRCCHVRLLSALARLGQDLDVPVRAVQADPLPVLDQPG